MNETWVKGFLGCLFCFIAHSSSVALAPFVEKAVFALLYCFYTFVKDELGIFVGISFWVLCYVPLIDVSFPPPIPQS